MRGTHQNGRDTKAKGHPRITPPAVHISVAEEDGESDFDMMASYLNEKPCSLSFGIDIDRLGQ